MLILSRVCADFHDAQGRTLFAVTPERLLSFLEAPEEIRQDPLFDMLVADGSLEAVHSVEQQRELEADPLAGTDAEGKKSAGKVGEAEKKAGGTKAAAGAEGGGTGKAGADANAAGAGKTAGAGSSGAVKDGSRKGGGK